MFESSPEVAERIPFSYGVYVPSIPALRKYKLLLCRHDNDNGHPPKKRNIKFFKPFVFVF